MGSSPNGIHFLRNLSKPDAEALRMETARRVAAHLAHGALLDFEHVCRGSLNIRVRPAAVNMALCGLANFVCTAVEAATKEALSLLGRYGDVGHDDHYLVQQIEGYTNRVRNHHAYNDAYSKAVADLRLFSRSNLFYFNVQGPSSSQDTHTDSHRNGSVEGSGSGSEEPAVPLISALQVSLEHAAAAATPLTEKTVIFDLGSDVKGSLENLYRALEIQLSKIERFETEQPEITAARAELQSFIQGLLKEGGRPENLQEAAFGNLPLSPPLSPGSDILNDVVQVISSAVPNAQRVSTTQNPTLYAPHKDVLGYYFWSEANTLDLLRKIQEQINGKVQPNTVEAYLLRGVEDALREYSNPANMITFARNPYKKPALEDDETIEPYQGALGVVLRTTGASSNDNSPSAVASTAENEAAPQPCLEVRSMLDMSPEMREHFMHRASGLMQVLGSRELNDEEFEGLWQLWTRPWHKTSCGKISSAKVTANCARFIAPGLEKLLDMRAGPEQRYPFRDYLGRMMQVLGSRDLNDEEFEALWNIWSRHYKA